MHPETFLKRSSVPATAAETFAWHERPGALERLTPPWQRVEVLDRFGGIQDGARVRLKLTLGLLPLTWLIEHRDYQPPVQFRDVQVRGPFAAWSHVHRIIDCGRHCELEDEIRFRLPGERLFHRLLAGRVHQQLARVFRYRHDVTIHDLAASASRGVQPMNVLISGSTGLIGSALVPRLTTAGHSVLRLVRKPSLQSNEVHWNPMEGSIDAAELDGIDAVVHLAGENIASRWTAAQKKRIRESRQRGTQLLAETLARLKTPPKVLVSASAIGIYGDRGDGVLDESSAAGTGFLADVCRDWENATRVAKEAGIRVVNLRFGVILSPAGGALAKMLTPFRLGFGGRLGDGKQYMSWIAIDDAVEVIYYALATHDLTGPVNVVAPEAVTNLQFTKTLGRVLHRPTLFPVPALAARLAFGQMADEALLASARVDPARLKAAGFTFRFPSLEPALRHVLGR